MGIYKAVASVRSGSKMPRCQYQITSIFLVHFNTFWVLATIYKRSLNIMVWKIHNVFNKPRSHLIPGQLSKTEWRNQI